MAGGKLRVSFVCLGNICRSPTAEAVFKHLIRSEGCAEYFEIESAGTGNWHVGSTRDKRTIHAAKRRGIVCDGVAKQFQAAHFERLDYVLAMDKSNYANLLRLAPNDAARSKVHLLREFENEAGDGAEVPDPYYGEHDGFEEVLDICERACLGFLNHVRKERGF